MYISEVNVKCFWKKHKRFGFMTLLTKTYDTLDISSPNITSSATGTSVKADEDALQYIKMYVAGVSAKTAERYFKNLEEQVIRL